MKRIILFILLIIYSNSNSQWTLVSTIPSNQNIYSISVVDQNIIWISGNLTSLYKTTDGGLSWISGNTGLPSGRLYGISALDESTCWVGTQYGSIYKTSDGGSSWTLQLPPTGYKSDGIKMFNKNYGVYMGDPSGIGQPFQFRYTTNGGENWILSPSAPVAVNEVGAGNAWDWTDTSHFWIGSGNIAFNATTARVFRTSSGFSGDWLTADLHGIPGNSGIHFQGIAFTDSIRGMAGTNRGGFSTTMDGGASWTVVSNPTGFSGFSTYTMNGIKDGSNTIRAFLEAESSFNIFKTTDFGTTWEEEPIYGYVIYDMEFLNANLGFAVGRNGKFLRYGTPTGISPIRNEIQDKFILSQNYPNPFNPSTNFNFSIPKNENVSLKIYDVLGNEVETLVNGQLNAGTYGVDFDGSKYSSGIYFYTLISGSFKETKRMNLIK
jgi:hypothetical protein